MSQAFKLTLDIQFATEALEQTWSPLISKRKIGNWIKKALQQDASMTVRFDIDPNSNALNADLVICLPVLKKEALAQKKSIEQHLIHLIVHGTLHAQGFDHEDEIEAEAMEELEIKILKSLQQANPYC
jgi:probable rRNA maturation factor